ncbi:MAG: nuclear transport factor 2 family protein [Bacteroidota bacterium]
MKLLKSSLFSVIFLLTTLCLSAQSAKDTIAIKETALNYIEGYFYKDAKRMKKALHPELVKRSIQKTKDGTEFIINLGASYMIMRTANNTNRHAANPEGPIESIVEIYDIVGNAATVKVSTNQYGFIDYLHIGKYNNEWKIINVFWTNLPKEEK